MHQHNSSSALPADLEAAAPENRTTTIYAKKPKGQLPAPDAEAIEAVRQRLIDDREEHAGPGDGRQPDDQMCRRMLEAFGGKPEGVKRWLAESSFNRKIAKSPVWGLWLAEAKKHVAAEAERKQKAAENPG